MRISFSTATFYACSLGYSLRLARDVGFDGVELALGVGYQLRGPQPYLQFPWSYEIGAGWGTSGMVTTFFFPSDLANKQTTEATFVLEKKVTDRASLFVEYVGDYPSHGSSVQLFNTGGGYLLTRTQQIDFHVAFGLNRNSPNYIVGLGYSFRFDDLFRNAAR